MEEEEDDAAADEAGDASVEEEDAGVGASLVAVAVGGAVVESDMAATEGNLRRARL